MKISLPLILIQLLAYWVIKKKKGAINIEVKSLKRLRVEKGLTQPNLANFIESHREKISSWENGRSVPNDIEKNKLCLIFHTTENELEESINLTLSMSKNIKITKPHKFSFRASDDLFNKITENANKANMKPGTYIAETYEGGEVVVLEGLKEFVKELNKVGINLNQLTKLCNMGSIIAPELDPIKDTINKIYIKLNRLI